MVIIKFGCFFPGQELIENNDSVDTKNKKNKLLRITESNKKGENK